MNKIHLIGNLTRNVDLKYTNNNIAVANYTIAVNTGYGDFQETNFINIISWGKAAEFVSKHFFKGQSIAVTGKLKNKNYKDKNGVNHYSMEVVTEEIEFVGSKTVQEKELEEFIPNFEITDDELPWD